MRRLLTILTLVMCAAVLAHAQADDHDDHNDNAPVAVGYAVVTPATATNAGLVVFETFGLRNFGPGGVTQAGVLPANLTTNAVLFVDTSGRLGKNIGVAMVNPNAASASVTLTLKNGSGGTISTVVVSVPSRQQVAKFITE